MKKYVKPETVDTVERERERKALYLTWKNSVSAIVGALQISQTTNLIASSRQNKSSYNQPHINNKIVDRIRQINL